MNQRRISTNTPSRRTIRRGSLLAQMVIVMSCMSILVTLSGMLLFRLFHQQAEMTKSVVQTGTWTRLAHDFRSDVHDASLAQTTGGDGDTLELTVQNGTVTWRQVGEFVFRTQRSANSQTPVESTPGERYLCPGGSARFSLIETPGRSPLAVLRIHPAMSAESRNSATSLHVSAAVGLNRRHERETAR